MDSLSKIQKLRTQWKQKVRQRQASIKCPGRQRHLTHQINRIDQIIEKLKHDTPDLS